MDITCVLPAHDAERTIDRAIESVLAQSHPPTELLVVDDGSGDATAARVEARAAPVKCLRRARGGPSAARNTGIRAAQGDLVAFLDADDRWLPGKLALQHARFAARADLALSAVGVRTVWDDDVAERITARRAGGEVFMTSAYHFSSIVVRRHVFDRIGLFDEAFSTGEDTEWLRRFDASGLVAEALVDTLVERRLHAGNVDRYVAHRRGELFASIRAYLAEGSRGPGGR